MSRYKILLINIGLTIILAIVWALFSDDPFTARTFLATLALISLVAGPVDLITGVVFLLINKKERGYGFLISAAFFGLVILLLYLFMKGNNSVPAIMQLNGSLLLQKIF
ncbi:MAG TPA: hypothetical protein VHD35_16435 [Chitinophagaceae bacterium]|nr:hypothetical protein [Chitinophagaceae bacterium]